MDFYILLGIERGASLSEVKRAYKRLARRYHPDINPGNRTAATHFRQILEAYETLSDPDRRRQYDIGVTVSQEDPPFGVGFQGFDFSTNVSGASAPTFGDLFADVLQDPRGGRQAEQRGADLHHEMSCSFQDAMRGGQCRITTTRLEHCRTCRGTGRVRTDDHRCQACHGTGSLQAARGHMVFSRPCAQCRGTGRVAEMTCSACGGRQTELRTETVTVSMPAGLEDGARIRVGGKGHAGRHGGAHGDLLVTVHVEPDPLFRREGDHLHVVVPIAIHEAALGAKVEVPTLDGMARLRIPPGTQSGQRFRLHERGAPSVSQGTRGDLIVEVKLVLPRLLDERSKALLREFGQINADDDVRRDVTIHTPPHPPEGP